MTPTDLSRHIPPEVVEAAARAMAVENDTREDWWRFYEGKARAALAAGLAVWPNAWTSQSVGNGSLILPIPQEGGE